MGSGELETERLLEHGSIPVHKRVFRRSKAVKLFFFNKKKEEGKKKQGFFSYLIIFSSITIYLIEFTIMLEL